MHEPGNGDAQDVQGHHGRGEDAHVQDVGSGCDDGGDYEDTQDGITDVVPHPAGADNAHERQEKYQNRHFKNYAQADDDGQKQGTVFGERDHRLEVFAVADQEYERLRQNHFVAEVAAGEEQSDGRCHERHDVALFVAVKTGRNEAPDLVEHEGRGDKQAGHHSDFQIEIERLDGIDVNQLCREAIPLERVHDRTLHDGVNTPGISPTGEEADDNSDDGIDEALAQFLEMVEEAHG